MAQKRRKRRQTRPKQRAEEQKVAQRDKIVHSRELRDSVAEVNKRLIDADVEVPRELFGSMAAIEALSDLLVGKGIIDRVDLNNGRLHYVHKYLLELESKNTSASTAEGTT